MSDRIGNYSTENVKIMAQLKYQRINLIVTWSVNCFIIDAPVDNEALTFVTIDTKLYAPVVTLSTQDNLKLLQQLKSGFKKTISWKKYQSKLKVQKQNRYLDYLIDPSC